MENELVYNFLYSCSHKSKFGAEQLVQEHALSFVVTGKIQFTTNTGVQVYAAGDIGLLRKNQLAKALKLPDEAGYPFKSITVFLSQNKLRSYALEHSIKQQDRYAGIGVLQLNPNTLLSAFFASLVPYFGQPRRLSQALANIKTDEAIELLLLHNADLIKLLFDFSEPFKIDLETYMLQNFEFNIPLQEFARLTGRSISTFKRDFQRVFLNTPEKWLKRKRLEKAYYLIKDKEQSPSDVYLRVGFENFSHFSKAFKEQYGVNASSLR